MLGVGGKQRNIPLRFDSIFIVVILPRSEVIPDHKQIVGDVHKIHNSESASEEKMWIIGLYHPFS